jgi:hypothetical protein
VKLVCIAEKLPILNGLPREASRNVG